MDDPDAPVGLWVHWVVYDLPGASHGLAPNQPRSADLAGGARQGRNSWSRLGWNGPDPPPGKVHRYFFKLYALNAPLGLEAGASAQKVEAAMKGKVLAEASLMGDVRPLGRPLFRPSCLAVGFRFRAGAPTHRCVRALPHARRLRLLRVRQGLTLSFPAWGGGSFGWRHGGEEAAPWNAQGPGMVV